MKNPAEILTYEQFVEEMKNPEFQGRMHHAMRTLIEIVEKDPSMLVGDDERMSRFWARYHNDPSTPKPGFAEKIIAQAAVTIKTNFTVEGVYNDNGPQRLFLDGKEIVIEKSKKVWHKSDEFSWGYSGSGPAQTALAICLEVMPKDAALNLFQDFKFKYVAAWPQAMNFKEEIDITDFLIDHRHKYSQERYDTGDPEPDEQTTKKFRR